MLIDINSIFELNANTIKRRYMVNKKKTIFIMILIFILIGLSILYFKARNKDDFNNINSSKSVLATTNEFNNVEEMKKADLSEGDIVYTEGYFNKNDNGGATYEIVTYDKFYETLPEDIKAVAYRNDKWGLGNPVWTKTPVDEYGNHTLDNGLVAKLLVEDIITPEQWGAVGDGVTDNTEQLIHLFAHTKKGYIKFKENATYLMKSRSLNKKGIETGEKIYNLNEYIWLMCGSLVGGASQGKPVMANIDGVTLDGNNCTIKIAEDDFTRDTNDFGIFNFAKSIKNLEIKNFNFDGNGLSQKENSTRTTNHTLVYLPGIHENIVGGEEIKLSDLGIDGEKLKEIKNEFSNVKIHNNNFKNSGTGLDVSDGGGDFVLIINPDESHDVYIENNYFEDWGRWVFSVDLGGQGECFENYKFNNNTCVQTENNKLDNGRYRGLGWIDFEARKCWKNLEIKDNYVEGVVGFAINGNGKVSENVTISGNTIIQPERDYKSSYEYMFEFYGVQMKDLLFENNNIQANGEINFGYTLNNITVKNNTLISPITLNGIYGDIIIENNKREDKCAIVQLLGLALPTYILESDIEKCNFIFVNNEGGIEGPRGNPAMFCDPNTPGKYEYINIKIEDNDSKLFNIVAWDAKDFTFNPNQVDRETAAFSVRGAKFTNQSYTTSVNNLVLGGGLYDEDNIATVNLNNCKRKESPYFYKDIDTASNNSLLVTKAGYLPMNGSFLLANDDIKFEPGMSVNRYAHIYTDKELYITCNEGTLGNEIDSSGEIVISGDVKLLHVATLAEVKAINK